MPEYKKEVFKVEQRESNTSHGLKPPTKKGTPEFEQQVQDTILLHKNNNEDVVYAVLEKYNPIKAYLKPIKQVMSEFGVQSWNSISEFVRNDECIDFFMMLKRYVESKGIKQEKPKDFILGKGIGIVSKAIDRLERALQKGFDAKYFFAYNHDNEGQRPLQYIHERLGCEVDILVNGVHPNHPTYPAGHGVKFYKSVDAICDLYKIDEDLRKELIIIAYTFAMGRSGLWFHFPEDNIAGGYLAGLKEFKNWSE